MLPILAHSLVVHAATINVGPGDDLQAAVDSAAPGDTIEVAPGTYEGVTITIDLTLVGTGGSGQTTISTFIGDTLNIEGNPTVVVEGFTFDPGARAVDVRGGEATLRDIVVSGQTVFDRPGAALRAHPQTTVIIEDSTFEDNESTFWPGGHVYAELATVEIVSSTLEGGSAPEGGALFAVDSTVVLDDVVVSGGNAEFGAGLFVEGSELELLDAVVEDNDVRTTFTDPDGGGLFADDSVVFVEGGSFSGNTGGVTGGGMRLEACDTTMIGVRLEDNRADFGGAVYVDEGSLEVVDSFFTENAADDGSGGAIRWRHDGGILLIEGSRFDGNTASEAGGAVATHGIGAPGELVVTTTTFEGNTAGDEGGGLAASDHGLVELEDDLFCGNEAVVAGGGAWVNGDPVWVSLSDFVGNGAATGGGLTLISAPDSLVVNNDFLANEATDGGAFSAAASDVSFLNNVVMGNTGTGGTAYTTTGVLDYNLFWDNTPADLSKPLAAAAGPGNLYTDPLLTDFSDDGDCDNDDLTPQPGSPLIDAGDPTLADPGGSRSDIGSVVDQTLEPPEDLDGDGVYTPDDCDDTDNTVFPGATEDCTNVDRDCSGDPYDAANGIDYYEDADEDGFGNPLSSVNQCEPPAGYVTDGTDCRDDDADIFPGATEVCNGLDDDCDTIVDDGITTTWYPDGDGDGWGAGASVDQCDQPVGYVDLDGDCDDTDPDIYPTAPDAPGDGVDSNCDGADGTATTGSGTDPDVTGSGTDGGPDAGADLSEAEDLKASGSCGCQTPTLAGGGAAPWLALLWLVAARSRRRS